MSIYQGKSKTTSKLQLTLRFGLYITVLSRRNGSGFAIKYLKACQLALQRKLAGTPVRSLREIEPDLPLPRLSKSGLPIIIGLSDRRGLCSGGVSVTRFWLSLFNLYRVLSMDFKPKLNTITDPFQGIEEYLDIGAGWMQITANRLLKYTGKPSLPTNSLLKIWKASSTSKVSWHGMLSDLVLLNSDTSTYRGRRLITYIYDLIQQTNPELDYLFDSAMRTLGLWSPYYSYRNPLDRDIREKMMEDSFAKRLFKPLGKLAPKEEAAGKLRIFALVDVWSQSALKPIHEFFFEILKGLPNDGTFDQTAAVTRGAEKGKMSGEAYCFDLSSATDRLPMRLQHSVVSTCLGLSVADAWEGILLGRSYAMEGRQAEHYGLVKNEVLEPLRFVNFRILKFLDDLRVKYAVGQPMGAYSS